MDSLDWKYTNWTNYYICLSLKSHKVGRLSLQMSHEPQQARAYHYFCSTKLLGVILLLPEWDASPSQGYPHH